MDASFILIAVAVLLAVLLLVVVVVLARLGGRLAQLSTGQTAAQAQLTRTLEERLDAVTKRLGDSLSEQTEKTGRNLTDLQKRLAVIDSAQKNITELSSQFVSLQDILSNKQARGAFGDIQLRDLVADALPPRAYEWQATLSNRKRVDCLVKLPTPPGPIAIDSKFPLEGYRALREAPDEAAALLAGRKFSDDVRKHVRDIQERYIIPGETADWAILFLPSEAVYAEIHANFPNVVEEAHRRHVAIVSPTTLMATLNTVRAILKDTQMREQAGFIQTEVEKMLNDVGRLDKRVGELQQRFHKAEESIREIRISTDKITGRGDKIVDAELGEETPAEDLPPPQERIERSG
ncbi:MAG: DNA recombination protein RmuC [Proteobacteria bacterium]|nr:DNA recombination protein RmuC [Pseudomonadota bacterium]